MHIPTITQLLRDLTDLTAADQIAQFRAEVINSGDIWTDAIPGGSHLYEISLHEIVGRGMSQHAACADWMRAAQDLIDNATPPPNQGKPKPAMPKASTTGDERPDHPPR